MMVLSRGVAWTLLVSLVGLPSCAWSNTDNRPVWNAFENHLVPESDGLFVAALPVTIPLGLVSIVVDTLVAHPIQVIDDAYEDAAAIWDPDDLEFDRAYYTEMAFLPLRGIATPITFAGSFLGRVLFDIPAPRREMTKAERLAAAEQMLREREQRMRAAFLTWLREPDSSERAAQIEQWHASFEEPMREALAADAQRRVRLHAGMLRRGMTKIGTYDAEVGLRDPDPVVRYTCIKNWPRGGAEPSAQLIEALRSDPVESVRLATVSAFRR